MQEYENYYAKKDDSDNLPKYIRERLIDLILKNSKCKVPWSMHEILEVQ